jgi:hypothetical protein
VAAAGARAVILGRVRLGAQTARRLQHLGHRAEGWAPSRVIVTPNGAHPSLDEPLAARRHQRLRQTGDARRRAPRTYLMSPVRIPMATAWARSLTPRRSKIALLCERTVDSEMPRRRPISGRLAPSDM